MLVPGCKIKKDTVFLPSFVCNVMLAPFNYLGINVEYFEVERDLSPDIDSIKAGLKSSVKAIVAVNYFGFPSKIDDIRQICSDNKIFYIEDNAHGLLSGYKKRPLGSFGDISIFSLRKTLPVPNGAALVINNEAAKAMDAPLLKKSGGEAVFLLRQAVKKLINRKNEYVPKDEPAEEENNLEKYLVKQSRLTEFIASRGDIERIKAVRRTMFLRLLDTVRGAEPVYDRLPDDVVPYAFPVYAQDIKGFICGMYKKGVCCFPWPTLPYGLSKYPDRYKHVVLMPVWREYGN